MLLIFLMSLFGLACCLKGDLVPVSNVKGSTTSYMVEIQEAEDIPFDASIMVSLPNCVQLPRIPICQLYGSRHSGGEAAQCRLIASNPHQINITLPFVKTPIFIKVSEVKNRISCTNKQIGLTTFFRGLQVEQQDDFAPIFIMQTQNMERIDITMDGNTTNTETSLKFYLPATYSSVRIKINSTLKVNESTLGNNCIIYWNQPLIQCSLINESNQNQHGNTPITIHGINTPRVESDIDGMLLYAIGDDRSILATFQQKSIIHIRAMQIEGEVKQQSNYQNSKNRISVSFHSKVVEGMDGIKVKLEEQWEIQGGKLTGMMGNISQISYPYQLIINNLHIQTDKNVSIQLKVKSAKEAGNYPSIIEIYGQEDKLAYILTFSLEVENILGEIQVNPSIQVDASSLHPTSTLNLTIYPALPINSTNLTCYIGAVLSPCSYNSTTANIHLHVQPLISYPPIVIYLPCTIQTQAYHMAISNSQQMITKECIVGGERLSDLECEAKQVNKQVYHLSCNFINQFSSPHGLMIQLPSGAVFEGVQCLMDGEFVEMMKLGNSSVFFPLFKHNKQRINVQMPIKLSNLQDSDILFSIISNHHHEAILSALTTSITILQLPNSSNEDIKHHVMQLQSFDIHIQDDRLSSAEDIIISLGDGLSTHHKHYAAAGGIYYFFTNYYIIYVQSPIKVVLRDVISPAYSCSISSSILIYSSSLVLKLETFVKMEEIEVQMGWHKLGGKQVLKYEIQAYWALKWSHHEFVTSAELSCEGLTFDSACTVVQSSAECSVNSSKVLVSGMNQAYQTTIYLIVLTSGRCTLSTFNSDGSPIGEGSIDVEKVPKKTNWIANKGKEIYRPASEGYISHLLFDYHTFVSKSKPFSLCFVIPHQFDFISPKLTCALNNKTKSCSSTPNCTVLMEVKDGWNMYQSNKLSISTAKGIMFPTRSGLYVMKGKVVSLDGSTIFESSQFLMEVLPKPITKFSVSALHAAADVENVFTFALMTGDKDIPSNNQLGRRGRVLLGIPLSGNPLPDLGSQQDGFVEVHCRVLIEDIYNDKITCRLANKPYPEQNSYTFVQVVGFPEIKQNTSLEIHVPVIRASSPIDQEFSLLITAESQGYKNIQSLYEDKYKFSSKMFGVLEMQSWAPSIRFNGTVSEQNQEIPITVPGSSHNISWIIIFPLEFQLVEVNNICFLMRGINWIVCRNKQHDLNLKIKSAYPSAIPDNSLNSTLVRIYDNLWQIQKHNWTISKTSLSSIKPGKITDYSFTILSSKYNSNTGQNSVSVLLSFVLPHPITKGGIISIQFIPISSSLISSISSNCTSAVGLGSQLYSVGGGNEGLIDCCLDTQSSWTISSFQNVSANSTIKIEGHIVFSREQIDRFGTVYIGTYNEKMLKIDESEFNLNLGLQKQAQEIEDQRKWFLNDQSMFWMQNQVLRTGHEGELIVKIDLPFDFTASVFQVVLPRQTINANSGGFNGPYTSIKCSINSNNQCQVTDVTKNGSTITYQITSEVPLAAGSTNIIVITSSEQDEGIIYPTKPGHYPIQINIYNDENDVFNSLFTLQVQERGFGRVRVFSTVREPAQKTLLFVSLTPSVPITTDESIVMEFPTISIDGEGIIGEDLGMKYDIYQHLHTNFLNQKFSSTTCRVSTGNRDTKLPTKIVCFGWKEDIQIQDKFQMVFQMYNPSIQRVVSIPLTIYTLDEQGKKHQFQVLEFSVQVNQNQQIIHDMANFDLIKGENSSSLIFTLRNSKEMHEGDYYILKYYEYLTIDGSYEDSFFYNIDLNETGDVIFLKNCSAVALRVGQSALRPVSQEGDILNGLIEAIYERQNLYPYEAYALYMNSETLQRIVYKLPNYIQVEDPALGVQLVYPKYIQSELTDYCISFCLSQTYQVQLMRDVRKVSFQFPPGLDLKGGSCIQVTGSQIPLQKCEVDEQKQVLWISLNKSIRNLNEFSIQIQTAGYAVWNENQTKVDFRNSKIKFYTWNAEQPELDPESDDFVIVKHDQTNLPSIIINYTALEVESRHSNVSFYLENFVNQFILGSDQITSKMKVPFIFKFYAMTNFLPLTDEQYHRISINFSKYYYADLPITNKDLVKYYPSCRIQRKSKERCQIVDGIISMQFQDSISEGEQVLVEFSVINPFNAEDNGFSLIGLSSPLASLPIQFLIHREKKYITQAGPFHTYFDAANTSIYPSFGIHSIVFDFGTKVTGKLNYIDFTILFHRDDINGLVLEIPIFDEQGRQIYHDPTLLGLDSGESYPCSVGLDKPVFCYYEKGSSEKLGKPNRIFISKFKFPKNKILSLRLLLTNPTVEQIYPSFIFTALGGEYAAPFIMGSQLKGRYQISEAFKTYPVDLYSSSPTTCNIYPSSGLWNSDNEPEFHVVQPQSAQSYVVLEWTLETQSYGEISRYRRKQGQVVDEFIISQGASRKIFLVKKLQSGYDGSTGSNSLHYSFGYLRNKHYLFNQNIVHLLQKPNYVQLLCPVDTNFQQNYRKNHFYGKIEINNYDIKMRLLNRSTWHYVQLYLGNLTLFKLNQTDPSDLTLSVSFIDTLPYSSMESKQLCEIQSGVTSTNKLKVPFCEQDIQNNRILFKNINKFSSDFLRFHFKAKNHQSQYNVSVRIYFSAYANEDSFQNTISALLAGQTRPFTPKRLPHYGTTLKSLWDGNSKVWGVSSTSISFNVSVNIAQNDYTSAKFSFSVPRIGATLGSCTGGTIEGNTLGSLPISNVYSTFHDSQNYYYFSFHYQLSGFNYSENEYYKVTLSCDLGDISYQRLWTAVSTVIRLYYEENGNDIQEKMYFCPDQRESTYFIGGKKVYSDSFLLSEHGSVEILGKSHFYETELSIQLTNFYFPVGASSGTWLNIFIDHKNIENPFPDTSSENAFIDCKCLVGEQISEKSSTIYQHPDCVKLKVGSFYSIGVWIDVAISQSLVCYFPGFVPSWSSGINLDVFRKTDLLIHQHSERKKQWNRISFLNVKTDFVSFQNRYNVFVTQDWEKIFASQSLYQVHITMNPPLTQQPIIYMSSSHPELSVSFCYHEDFLFCRVYKSFINRRYYLVAQSQGVGITSLLLRGNATAPPSVNASNHGMYVRIVDPVGGSGIWTEINTSTELEPTILQQNAGISPYSSDVVEMQSTVLFAFNVEGKILFGTYSILPTLKGSSFHLALQIQHLTSCSSIFSSSDNTLIPLDCSITNQTLIISSTSTHYLEGTLHIIVHTSSLPPFFYYLLTLYDQYISQTIYSEAASSIGIIQFTNQYPSHTVLNAQYIKWKRMAYKQYRVEDGPIRVLLTNNYTFTNDESPSPYFLIKSTGYEILPSDHFMCFIYSYHPTFIQFEPNQAQCSYHSAETIKIKAILWDSMENFTYELVVYRNNQHDTPMLIIKDMDSYNITMSTVDNNHLAFQNEDYRMRYSQVYPVMLQQMQIITTSAQQSNSLLLLVKMDKQVEDFHFWEFVLEGLKFSEGISCSFGQGFAEGRQVKCMFEGADDLVVRVLRTQYPTSSISNKTMQNVLLLFELGINNFINPQEGTQISLRVSLHGSNSFKTSYFPSLFFITPTSGAISSSTFPSSSTFGETAHGRTTITWPFTTSLNDKLVLRLDGLYALHNDINSISLSSSVGILQELWGDSNVCEKVYRIKQIKQNDLVTFQLSFVYPYSINKGQLQDSSQISLTTVHEGEMMIKYKRMPINLQCQASQPYTKDQQTSSASVTKSTHELILHIQLDYTFGENLTCSARMFLQFSQGMEQILLITFAKSAKEQIYTIKKFGSAWNVQLYGIMNEGTVDIWYVPNDDPLEYSWIGKLGQASFSTLGTGILDTPLYNHIYRGQIIRSGEEHFIPYHHTVDGPVSGGFNKLSLTFTPPRAINSHEIIKITLKNHQFSTPSTASIKCLMYPTRLCKACYLPLYVACFFENEAFYINAPQQGIFPIQYALSIQYFGFHPYLVTPSSQSCSKITINLLNQEGNVTNDPVGSLDVCLVSTFEYFSVGHSTFINGEFNVATFYLKLFFNESDPFIDIQILSSNVESCLGFTTFFLRDGRSFKSGDQIGIETVPASSAQARLFCANHNRVPKIVISNMGTLLHNITYQIIIPLAENPIAHTYFQYKAHLFSHQRTLLCSSEFTQTRSTLEGNEQPQVMTMSATNAIVDSNMSIKITFSESVSKGEVILVKLHMDNIRGIKQLSSLKALASDHHDFFVYHELGLCLFVMKSDVESAYVELGRFQSSIEQNVIGVKWVKIYPDISSVRVGQFDHTHYPFPFAEVRPLTQWTTANFYLHDAGEAKTNAVGKYTFTFATTLLLPSHSYIIISIQPIFSIPYQHCYSCSGLVGSIVCQKHRKNQLRIFGYQDIEPNRTINITVYLKIQKKSLGLKRSIGIITVHALNNHMIIRGPTEPLYLNITEYGSYVGSLEQYMKIPYFDEDPSSQLQDFTLLKNVVHKLGQMSVVYMQISINFTLSVDDTIVLELQANQTELEMVEYVFLYEESGYVGWSLMKNRSIDVIIPFEMQYKCQLYLFLDVNLGENSGLNGRVKREDINSAFYSEQTIAKFNVPFQIVKGSASQLFVDLSKQHIFSFPQEIAPTSIIIVQYCKKMILPDVCQAHHAMCIIHAHSIILITNENSSSVDIKSIEKPFMCQSTQIAVYSIEQDTAQQYEVNYQYVLEDYSDSICEIIKVDYLNNGNKAIVGKQALAIITISPQQIISEGGYAEVVIENTLMNFISCGLIEAVMCKNKTITLFGMFNQTLELRIKYKIQQSSCADPINTWIVSTYKQGGRIGTGNDTLSIELIKSIEGNIQVNNPQACMVGHACTLSGAFIVSLPVSTITITLPSQLSLNNLSYQINDNNCQVNKQTIEIQCENVIIQVGFNPGLVLTADQPGLYKVRMDFLQNVSMETSIYVDVEVTGTQFPQLSGTKVSNNLIIIFFTSTLPLSNFSSLHLSLPSASTSINCTASINDEYIGLTYAVDGEKGKLSGYEIDNNSEVVLFIAGVEINDTLELAATEEQTQLYKPTSVQVSRNAAPSPLNFTFNATTSEYNFDIEVEQSDYVEYIILQIESELSASHHEPQSCSSDNVSIPCFRLGSTIILSPSSIISFPYHIRINLANFLYIVDDVETTITVSISAYRVIAMGRQQYCLNTRGMETISGQVQAEPKIKQYNDATYTIRIDISEENKYLHEGKIQFPSMFGSMHQVACQPLNNVNRCSINNGTVKVSLKEGVNSFGVIVLGVSNPNSEEIQPISVHLYEVSEKGNRLMASSNSINLPNLSKMQPHSIVQKYSQNTLILQNIPISIPAGSQLRFQVQTVGSQHECATNYNLTECGISDLTLSVYLKQIPQNQTLTITFIHCYPVHMGLINIFYHGVIWVQGKVQQNDIYYFYNDDEGSTFTSNQR